MVEYITNDGSPHVRSIGSTISNAARSAFVELITRHDLEDITIHGVTDVGPNIDAPPESGARVVHIEYTDRTGDSNQQTKIVADATPLTENGTPITPEDSEIAKWKVTVVDEFRHSH